MLVEKGIMILWNHCRGFSCEFVWWEITQQRTSSDHLESHREPSFDKWASAALILPRNLFLTQHDDAVSSENTQMTWRQLAQPKVGGCE